MMKQLLVCAPYSWKTILDIQILRILTEELEMRKVGAQWVPRITDRKPLPNSNGVVMGEVSILFFWYRYLLIDTLVFWFT